MNETNGKPRLPSLTGQPWLLDPVLQELLRALGGDHQARVIGGAVRNALMGEPVSDVDIATVHPPEEVMKRAREAGFSVHPVGLEHGSVVVSKRGRAFEVTTLRRDVETDGRHAVVDWTDDWRADAARRDFTVNALYADSRGRIHDPLGGHADLVARRLRFIGDAGKRIEEDYLRILRYFRFWARYGEGDPDEEALAAISARRAGLERISRERIRAELARLLVAPRALEALLHMADAGVLDHTLPPSCERDFTTLARMAADDRRHGLEPDWILRLAALCGPATGGLPRALRLSRAEAALLAFLRDATPPEERRDWRPFVFEHGNEAALAAVRLWHARGLLSDDEFAAALRVARHWQPPHFPLTGKDVIAAGIAPGPRVGQILRATRERWLANGFKPRSREKLLEMMKSLARDEGS